jgi:hypothetical protein
MADEGNWERAVLEKLAMAALKEQRAARQWGIFFKLAGLGILTLIVAVAMGWLDGRDAVPSGKHTAVVELIGVIESEGRAVPRMIAGLQAAFKDKDTRRHRRINSPGGSPVQVSQIARNAAPARTRSMPSWRRLRLRWLLRRGADKIFVDKPAWWVRRDLDSFGAVNDERSASTAGDHAARTSRFWIRFRRCRRTPAVRAADARRILNSSSTSTGRGVRETVANFLRLV